MQTTVGLSSEMMLQPSSLENQQNVNLWLMMSMLSIFSTSSFICEYFGVIPQICDIKLHKNIVSRFACFYCSYSYREGYTITEKLDLIEKK